MKRLKRFLFLLMVVLLPAISIQEASAAEKNLPEGFLLGDENGINVSKDGGYFFNLEDLRPGDTIKRTLTIKNFRDEAYDLRLVIEPKSKTGKIDLIENMSMQILLEDQEVYQGNLSTSKEGSKEVPFGLVAARSEKQAVIVLTMNDIEKWNKLYYSGPSEAEVEWQFIATASEKTTDEGESEVPKSPGGSQSSEPKGLFPRTGEILSNGFVWVGLILVAIVYIHSRKKRRSKYR